jgi:hypothetical protein
VRKPVNVVSTRSIIGLSPTLDPWAEEYGLHLDGVLIATCANPRHLSEWALDHGAASVRWGFDLGTVKD